MKRVLFFLYGSVVYFIFLGTFLYAAGFVGNFLVPKSIDSAAGGPLVEALLINSALLGLFALQHSIMARRGFKKWWTKIIPQPIERSTFVLFASAALILMYIFWRPIGGTVWHIENETVQIILYAACALGWLTVLVTTFLINHFELFGLQQVWNYLKNKKSNSQKFVTPGPYKMIRHPLYFGFILAFWATPTMTVAHLFFAIMTTAYILVAIQLEEKDLITEHGEKYTAYKKSVPMLLPLSKNQNKYKGALAE
jgi:protein-S-isoprenylcysteine O-methyltransferase Ste14